MQLFANHVFYYSIHNKDKLFNVETDGALFVEMEKLKYELLKKLVQ